jgi:hypothetical protein
MRGGDTPAGMRLATQDAGGGTIFTSANGASRTPRKPATQTADVRGNLHALAERYRGAMTPERAAELAVALGVTPAALDALGVGWATADDLRAMKASGAGWPEDPPNGAYAFPERDGDGRLVGFSLRASDGRKGAPSGAIGARRGLIVPTNLHDTTGLVLVVEGASDVAACLALGLAAVGRPSNAGGADYLRALLKRRDVLIVGENDAKPTGAWPGRDGAERVASSLATRSGEPVRWAIPPHGTKDVRACLAARVAAGLDLADTEACRAAGQELLAALNADATEAKPQKRPSVAEELVRLALNVYRLGRTEKDEAFAVPHDGANVALLLKGNSDALRARLARAYRAETGRTPGGSALSDALNVLLGEALDAEAEPVHLRIARDGESIVIDLADAEGRAVVVRAGAWEVVERSPVLFRRTALTAAMPIPERGGSLAELRDLLNVTADTWPLVLGWLIAAMVPDIPHPILLLSGLQGTGKSCAARTLVLIFDPSAAPLRAEPRKLDDWQVAAAGSWAVAIDNLSAIAPWLADALCRAATGDGLVKRALFTDSELAVLSFRRVIILTSIDAGALRGDLGERLLLADLEPIRESERREEKEIDAAFAERLPRVFGALLDAVEAVLAKLPDVRLERRPRMADFGRLLAACDAAGVTDGALPCYLSQGGRIAEEVVDSDPFGCAVVELIAKGGTWEGTATDLLGALLDDPAKLPHGWPPRNGVSGRLKRLIPALKVQDVRVTFERVGQSRRRIIRLESTASEPSASSASDETAVIPVPRADDGAEAADDLRDETDDVAPAGDDPPVGCSLPENVGTSAPADAADNADDVSSPLSNADEWGEL